MVRPAGPVPERRRSPRPVIRQMILSCNPFGSGSWPPSNSAHSSPPVMVPRNSGGPPGPFHGLAGDGGLQPGAPNTWPAVMDVVGLGDASTDFEGDGVALELCD